MALGKTCFIDDTHFMVDSVCRIVLAELIFPLCILGSKSGVLFIPPTHLAAAKQTTTDLDLSYSTTAES